MPIYEFICGECQKTCEHLLLKIGATLEEGCPHCKAPPKKLERILSQFGKHGSWSKWRAMENS